MYELRLVRERRVGYAPRIKVTSSKEVFAAFQSRANAADREGSGNALRCLRHPGGTVPLPSVVCLKNPSRLLDLDFDVMPRDPNVV